MSSSATNQNLFHYSNLQLNRSQVVLIFTEWNEFIIEKLMEGAKRVLDHFPQIEIHTIQVPGAIEIPYTIQQYHQHKKADAYIALGCVIKGETPHFDYVCKSVTEGITHLNVHLESPTIFGVLTVNNEQEALDRCGGIHGHKGEEAAIAAIKLMAWKQSLFIN